MTSPKLKPGTFVLAQPPWTLVERQIDLVYSLALRRSVSLVGVQAESVEYLWSIRRWRRGEPRQAILFSTSRHGGVPLGRPAHGLALP